MKKQKTNRVRIEIQVNSCYFNDGQHGSYFRVFATGRDGQQYTFSTKFSYMSCLPGEWVEIEGQVIGTAQIKKPLRVISLPEAKRMCLDIRRARKCGYLVDLKKNDPHAWLSDIRAPQPAGELQPTGYTADQEAALDDWYGNEFSHPNEKKR